TAEALHALAHLTSTTSTSLARALPAFGGTDARSPVRATTACHRCVARRGIHQPVPVHLPIHDNVCTRPRIWLAHADQPNPAHDTRLTRLHPPPAPPTPPPTPIPTAAAGTGPSYRGPGCPRLASLASRHPAPLETSAPRTADHQPSPRHPDRARRLHARGDLS